MTDPHKAGRKMKKKRSDRDAAAVAATTSSKTTRAHGHGRKLRICILSPDVYRSEMPARASIMEIYGRCFPAMGHDVTWVLPSEDEKDPEVAWFGGATLHLVPRKPFQGMSFAQKITNFRAFYRRYAEILEALDKTRGFDVIQGRDDIYAARIGANVARKSGTVFTFQYSVPIERLYVTRGRTAIYHPILNRIEKRELMKLMLEADKVLPTSKWLMDDLVMDGVPRDKMLVIPMGVNPHFTPAGHEMTELRRKYGIGPSEKVVMYLGDIDAVRDLEVLLKAFRMVLREHAEARLVMVGDGNGLPGLREYADKMGISDKVVFTGRVPYSDVPAHIAICDIGLSPFPPTPLFKTASATKMMDYMAIGRPVVGNVGIYDVEEGLNESRGGVLVHFDSASFAKGIGQLLADPEAAKMMGQAGKEWVIRNRSYDSMAETLEAHYLMMLERMEKKD